MKNTGDIKLTVKQARKVYIFEKLRDGKMNNSEAAASLALSVRQVQRIKKTFVADGLSAFLHGNADRKPANAISEEVMGQIVERASFYSGTSCQHISELLAEKDGVRVSAKSIARILKKAGISLTCGHKGPRKRLRRERRKKRGELVQIDASPFDWLSNGKMCSLHGGIADATGEITALWLTETEQLNGYFHVLENMIETSGVPRALYMDGHTIFFSPRDGKLTEEEELEGKTVALTQFGKALEILGIQPIRASSPQAKGRVERLWGTLQKRLPVEMRVSGVKSIEEANRFLAGYIERHNSHFGVEAADGESAFLPGPPKELRKYILCVRESRKAGGDSSITWERKKYIIEENAGERKLFKRGAVISVLKLMDGRLAAQYGDEIFEMKEMPENGRREERKEEEVKEAGEKKEAKKAYKPAPEHPWRKYKIHPAMSEKSLVSTTLN
jgi:transposase